MKRVRRENEETAPPSRETLSNRPVAYLSDVHDLYSGQLAGVNVPSLRENDERRDARDAREETRSRFVREIDRNLHRAAIVCPTAAHKHNRSNESRLAMAKRDEISMANRCAHKGGPPTRLLARPN